ncbi:hypothetical protein ACWD5R_16200 [Streptomyces sp. NPDC002514]|uniref:hypothetical protein n=1 Tax=Streptomyces sp. NPDC001270 TaxID=3364554 RepID=UPI0036CA9CF5
MDTENPSAPPHSESRIPGKNHPDRHRNGRPGGVIHDNARHSTHFTVIVNHLTQHRELSLLAIGLACHIQSLPTGAPVDIKTLAARFPEGPTRIAAALNELQDHGYLRRTRQRVDGGRYAVFDPRTGTGAVLTDIHPTPDGPRYATRKDFVYGEDVTIGDWTISTQALPRYPGQDSDQR